MLVHWARWCVYVSHYVRMPRLTPLTLALTRATCLRAYINGSLCKNADFQRQRVCSVAMPLLSASDVGSSSTLVGYRG